MASFFLSVVSGSITGLTQVWVDGTNGVLNKYVYGNSRVAQFSASTPTYFLADALGSVRQLADLSGAVILTKSYQPYGGVLSSSGSSSSAYGFTGEWTDTTGLVYLRARYYAPGTGRFISKDTWGGDYARPLTMNGWNYTNGNPINYTDPSGNVACKDILQSWQTLFRILHLCDPKAEQTLPQSEMDFLESLYQPPGSNFTICDFLAIVTPPNVKIRPRTKNRTVEEEPRRQLILPFVRTREESDHVFYYVELGKYPYPGRSTRDLLNEANQYRSISGVPGFMGQLDSSQRTYADHTGSDSLRRFLMGNKYEVERLIYWASNGMLESGNSTSRQEDFVIRNFYTIKYVEVKWSEDKFTDAADIVAEAKLHPTRTFLLETTALSPDAIVTLEDNGGDRLPYFYP